MDPIEQYLIDWYNIDPQAAKAMAQDMAAQKSGGQPMGDIGMSGGISRDSMYGAIRDGAAHPDRVVLPQEYQAQLDSFVNSSARTHQANLDRSLVNARGAMIDTTNNAINGGRTPSQVLQQSFVRPPAGPGPDRGNTFDAAGNSRIQQTPQQTIRPPAPSGQVPGGPDFNDKYVRYRKMLVDQDPNRGEQVFNEKLEQRRALLMQELQAIEGHRNGNGAAMAGADNALKASNELRTQAEYLGSGASSRGAYDDVVNWYKNHPDGQAQKGY